MNEYINDHQESLIYNNILRVVDIEKIKVLKKILCKFVYLFNQFFYL